MSILIIGNKPYYNFKLDAIVDSFDIIYRFNLAAPGNNNGTKFGKLVMCSHVYKKFVSSPGSKENVVDFYKSDYSEEFVSEYYDFFQENKDKFDEIFHQNEHDWGKWNELLTEYGSPHSFSQMASTGYSVIFKNLQEGNDDIYVLGFTLSDKEIRKTIGEEDDFALSKNQ